MAAVLRRAMVYHPGIHSDERVPMARRREYARSYCYEGRSNQSVGQYVCKYGKTTGYTCGYIESRFFRPNYIDNATPTFILVEDTAGYSPLVEVGDSGAPVFNGSTAFGTISGKVDTGKAIYMAVNYIYSGLAVNVITSS